MFVHVPKQKVKLVGSSDEVNHYIVIKKKVRDQFPLIPFQLPGQGCVNVMCGVYERMKKKGFEQNEKSRHASGAPGRHAYAPHPHKTDPDIGASRPRAPRAA